MPRLLVTAMLMLLLPASVAGQETERRSYYDDPRIWGVAAQVSVPYDEYAARYNTGFGLEAVIDYPLVPLLSFTGAAGYHRFNGKTGVDDADLWEAAIGGRFNLPPFFMGGEVAYYTELDRVNWVPSIGLRFEAWEFAIRWNAASTNGWVSYRAGFYF